MEKEAISISTLSGKMEGFRSICFSSLDNSFCDKMVAIPGTICEKCYSREMLRTFRKRARAGWKRNGDMMKEPLEDWQIPRFKPGEYVRFLSHGELETDIQFSNFCLIAKKNKDSFFTMWTKRMELIKKEELPENLRVILSSPFIGFEIQMKDMGSFGYSGIFTVYNNVKDIKENSIICEGKKCKNCMHCYSGEVGKYIGEVFR